MKEHHRPEWEVLDSVRSILDIGKTVVNELVGKPDTSFDNKVIETED